jgi:hypothetical protein
LHAAVVVNCAWWCRNNIQPTVKTGNKEGKGGVYNFVTKRGFARKTQKSWTQVETGSSLRKYHQWS